MLVYSVVKLETAACLFSCDEDYLEIFDGDSTSALSLGRFCGDSFVPLSSTQRFLTVQLITDGYDGDSLGFKLFYNLTTDILGRSGFKQYHF